ISTWKLRISEDLISKLIIINKDNFNLTQLNALSTKNSACKYVDDGFIILNYSSRNISNNSEILFNEILNTMNSLNSDFIKYSYTRNQLIDVFFKNNL